MNDWPAFYDPDKVGTLYPPATATAIAEGRAAGMAPAESDQQRTILLLVDPQVDFVHTDGALSVPGAIADTRRTIEWILQHAAALTAIAVSLDSHVPTQIFFPTWWVNAEGQHPAPFTEITSAEVQRGRWLPVYEPHWSVRYVHRLETGARKALMIWPYHTLIGTPGHSITPALYEAIAFHAAARQSQPIFLQKGSIPKTEHYSVLEPEVKVPRHPQGRLNTAFLSLLASYDRVYVAGQAKSHCVLETVTSVMRYFQDQPEMIARWRIVTDCMSPVRHPAVDFDALADRTFAHYAQRGLRLVRSTDPLD